MVGSTRHLWGLQSDLKRTDFKLFHLKKLVLLKLVKWTSSPICRHYILLIFNLPGPERTFRWWPSWPIGHSPALLTTSWSSPQGRRKSRPWSHSHPGRQSCSHRSHRWTQQSQSRQQSEPIQQLAPWKLLQVRWGCQRTSGQRMETRSLASAEKICKNRTCLQQAWTSHVLKLAWYLQNKIWNCWDQHSLPTTSGVIYPCQQIDTIGPTPPQPPKYNDNEIIGPDNPTC